MLKKIIFSLLVFLVILSGVFSLLYRFPDEIISDILFNIFSQAKQPYQEKVNLHLYGKKEIPLNPVLVRVYYLVAQDEEVIIDWQRTFSQALAKVNEFYELQFAYNIKLDFQIYPQVIYSDNNAEYFFNLAIKDYHQELASPHSPSLTLEEIIRELQKKIEGRNQKWDLQLTVIDNSYIVNLVVLGAGTQPLKEGDVEILGFNDEKNNSLVFSSIFTAPKYKDCYESVVAHEVGHGLGIPEFYTYYSNKVSSSGVMGGGFTRKLENNYLDHQIKVNMGL